MLFSTIFNLLFSFVTSVYFLTFLAILLFAFFLLYLYVTSSFGKWEKKYGIKGLKPIPFVGTEKDFLLGKKPLIDLVVERYKEFEGHNFGIIYQGARPAIFIHDVEFLKSVCIKDFDHFMDFFGEGLETVVDNNLFFMRGEKWRVSKAALSQVFRVKNVKEVLPKVDFCIKRSMNLLDSFARTKEDFLIDEKVIGPCLMDCVGHAICGVEIDSANDTRSEFMKMSQLLQSSVWRLILLNIAPKFMVFFGINVFYPKASKYFDKLLRQLVKDHKQSRKFDDMMGVHLKVMEEIEKKKNEILASGEEYIPLTEEMIISSCMQFFFDGVLTIETMLDVAVYYLAQNPEIQEKAYDEIQTVLGDRISAPDGSNNINDLPPITDTDIMEMKYIESIFDEASRIGPFPFISRCCTKDYPVPGTNFVIPKGTPMYVPIAGFHMNPKLFPNPEKFDPDRFSAENKGNLVTGSFIPFGLGPRMCLGKNIIRMEGRCYLANLIRSYRILPSNKTVKNLEWDVQNLGRIKDGLWVKVERREN